MVVGWDLLSGSNPVLRYDEVNHGTKVAAYRYSKTADVVVAAKGMKNHFARLAGLKPNTIYYFVVQDSEGVSRQLSFKTAPDDPYVRISVIAGGDSRNHREARRDANLLVSKLRPTLIMFNGDMTSTDTDVEWQEWMDDWQETISRDGMMYPVVAARGNHEPSNKVIVDMFDVPNSEVYYHLRVGGDLLHLYTLNSQVAASGAQRQWLEEALKKTQGAIWKMAQYHLSIRPHTAKKVNQEDMMVNWATLFAKYGVDVVLESDAHVVKWTYPIRPSRAPGSADGFIRDDEHGSVYLGEGTWGAPLRDNDRDRPWTRASGKFNAFFWIFFDTEKVEVRTIKTDRSEDVGSVSPANIFEPPIGLPIWNPTTGDVITIRHKSPLPPRPKAPEPVVEVKPPAPKADWSGIAVLPTEKGKVPLKYTLLQPCGVDVVLVNHDMEEVTRLTLPNQAKGAYNKVLDLSQIDTGEYLLLLKANGKVLERFRVEL